MTSARPALSRAVSSALAGVLHVEDASFNLPERAVQFGTGAFLRGFVDAFIDESNRRGQFMGRVVAVGSTGSGRDRAFDEQDGLYTLAVAGVLGGRAVESQRVISAVSRAVSASTQWNAVLACARDPEIRVIFSNTTEAGIARDPRDDAPEAVAFSGSSAPYSFPAKLTRFLYERAFAFNFAASAGVVVVPCELVEANGELLQRLVQEQATQWVLGDRFAAWMADAVRFCNTLVDRIVPGAPSDVARERMEVMHGYHDALLTTAEPYALFAIEGDSALAERLGFVDDAGVIRVVPDVRPYRERKVRLLNGTHTAMAAIGVLNDIPTVHAAMQTPALASLLAQLVRQDLVPWVDVPDAAAFAEDVLDRFANPQVQHRLTDIATQSTLKWKVRLLPMLLRHLDAADCAPPQTLVTALAAQLALSHPAERARREAAGTTRFSDDNGQLVTSHWVAAGPDAIDVFVTRVLADTRLWDVDLRRYDKLALALSETLHRLHHDGPASLLSPALVSS